MRAFRRISLIIAVVSFLFLFIKPNQGLGVWGQTAILQDIGKTNFQDQTPCQFVVYAGDIEIIAFQDGRHIYTLFTTHILNQEYQVQRALQTEFPEAAVNALNSILEEHRERVQSEQSDAWQIVDLVDREHIDWVGVEASLDEMEGHSMDSLANSYWRDRGYIDRKYGSNEHWSKDKTGQILYLMQIPYVIARANHPLLFANIRTVYLEDNEAKSRVLSIMSMISRLFRQLQNFVTREQLHVDDYERIIEIGSIAIGDNLLIPDEILKYSDLFQNEEVRQVVSVYFAKTNEFLDVNQRLDEAVVETALRQPGNGIILMGTHHKQGVQAGLMASCQN